MSTSVPNISDLSDEVKLMQELISASGSEAHKLAFAKILASIQDCYDYIKTIEAKYEEKFSNIETQLSLLNGRIKEQEADLEKATKDQRLTDCDRVKTHVILKGIPMHKTSKGTSESFLNSRKQVRDFLDKIGADSEQTPIVDAIRFTPPKTGPNREKLPLIRVIFATPRAKAHMYKKLVSNPEAAPEVSVQDAVPRCFTALKKTLDTEAYTLRKDEPTLKTRIICYNGEMYLGIKKKGEQKFTRHTDPTAKEGKKRRFNS